MCANTIHRFWCSICLSSLLILNRIWIWWRHTIVANMNYFSVNVFRSISFHDSPLCVLCFLVPVLRLDCLWPGWLGSFYEPDVVLDEPNRENTALTTPIPLREGVVNVPSILQITVKERNNKSISISTDALFKILTENLNQKWINYKLTQMIKINEYHNIGEKRWWETK